MACLDHSINNGPLSDPLHFVQLCLSLVPVGLSKTCIADKGPVNICFQNCKKSSILALEKTGRTYPHKKMTMKEAVSEILWVKLAFCIEKRWHLLACYSDLAIQDLLAEAGKIMKGGVSTCSKR